jgi:hypothetical protein
MRSFLLRLALLILPLLMAGFASSAHATPEVKIQPDPHPFRECYGFPDNAMEIFVVGGERESMTRQPFCTTRAPKVKIVADKKGRNYVLLDYARRDESSVDDVLGIFRLDGKRLTKIFETRLSCATRIPERARYAFKVESVKTSGLELTFNGSDGASTDSKLSNDDSYCDQPRTMWIDPDPTTAAIKPETFNADPAVNVVPVETLPGFPTPYPCSFQGDLMALKGTEIGGRSVAWMFCSAYGVAKATGFTDNLQRQFVLLEYREGHGTGPAVTQYLAIYRLVPAGPSELLRVTLAGGNPFEDPFEYAFAYAYSAKSLSTGGLELILGKRDGNHECCASSTENRTIWIDP